MKHEQYKTEFINLKENVITAIKHQLLNENATEIQLHNPIIHNFIDDQMNEVVSRVNVETASVQIDTGFDEYWNELTELSLDILLAILKAVETGSYEVWEEFES